ncbi:MAG TPA: hypothetical protein VFH54_06090 [Mycobacteriales bacterium]|nr:hypothetical protein [Mycobacteriales bacterium]
MVTQPRRRRTTTEQGLGWEHQKLRRKLLPKAYGTPCGYCGQLMVRGQPLDLDHSTPRAFGGVRGDRMVHRRCNQSAGGRIGAAMTNGTLHKLRRRRTSRSW